MIIAIRPACSRLRSAVANLRQNQLKLFWCDNQVKRNSWMFSNRILNRLYLEFKHIKGHSRCFAARRRRVAEQFGLRKRKLRETSGTGLSVWKSRALSIQPVWLFFFFPKERVLLSPQAFLVSGAYNKLNRNQIVVFVDNLEGLSGITKMKVIFLILCTRQHIR